MEYFTLSLVAVICAAVVGCAIRALWYSQYLFLQVWLASEGVSKNDIPKRSNGYTLSVLLYSFVAHAAIALVLTFLFELLQIKDIKTAISLTLLFVFGFMVTSRYIDMLYTLKEEHFKKKSQVSFLVASGYYILVSTCMTAIIIAIS